MTYKLDKSYSKSQSFKEADDHSEYWQDQSIEERLRASWYLICQAYGLEYSTKHKLDRTVHLIRKHKSV